ncbi:MAG: biotin--[acetyl-CoA-carboxylase] ligase [Chloroflexi bacterium]|nr:biotin--[acetyl-CoA-carboxylase] ligase [Chloroflexota bacterium]
MLTADLIRAALRDVPLISTVEHHASIGSTNDRARELANAGTPEIALISADEQLSGRGRQNRAWFTPPGTALAISLLTRPKIAAQHAMRLTMLAGLAVVEGIEQATGLHLDLKWPNDVVAIHNSQFIMHNAQSPIDQLPIGRLPVDQLPVDQLPLTRKVGGILTEASFQGDGLEYAVVGMGINVNVDFSRNAELRDIATSLKTLSGNPIDRSAVLKAIVVAFVERYAWLHDADRLREAWAARLINLGREIRVQLDDEIITGRSDDVDDDGALLLRTPDGQIQRLLAGDVTLHNLNL